LAEPEIEDKRITLAEAAKIVPDGSGLFWGGFGFQRPPIAFASELIRQKKRNLTIYTCGSEVDLEILVGAGVVPRLEIAFVAIEALGLANNMRRRVAGATPEFDEVSIEGHPKIVQRIEGGVQGDHGTVGMVLNMIPFVIGAQPGLFTMKDFPCPRNTQSFWRSD